MSKPYIVVGGKRHPIVHGIKLGKSAKFLDGYVKITAESIDDADREHTHSQYITNITSKMITDALGYTPSENIEVIDNLESTSTDSALSANQGKALKELVDAKQPKGDYAPTSHTHAKSEVGLGNVDNTADASKNVKSTKKIETYKQGSTTETYGDEYPIYAQWRDSSHVRMKCDNNTVETDYATTAGSANTVEWSGVNGKPAIPESGDYTSDNIEALLKKIMGLTPRMGSTCFTKDTHVGNTWWNFFYIPHRNGVGMDNGDYGTLLLFPMAGDGTSYIVRAGKGGVIASLSSIITSSNISSQSVNSATTVNGHTVESNVPTNAKFTDTVSDDTAIKQLINDIQIGGRNLLLNSNFELAGKPNWGGLSDTAYITNEGRNGGYCAKQIGKLNKDCNLVNCVDSGRNKIKIKANDILTFSGWYKVKDYVAGTTNNFVRPYLAYFNSNNDWLGETAILDISPDATDWTYVQASFKVPYIKTIDNMEFTLHARDYTGIIWWDDIKLEKGNKATDCTPAPEDINAELNKKADKEKYGDTTISVGRISDSAIGYYSFAFGQEVTASGLISHAEGCIVTASGRFSHAEGFINTASEEGSHAEGGNNTASGGYSHAEGHQNTASEYGSHVEGSQNIASGQGSHAEGNSNTASGYVSHAEGYSTTALDNQHAQGHFNNTITAKDNSTRGTSTGTAFVIGNGTDESSLSNAFRITGNGVIYATNAAVQTGADYAEYFEWSDRNPDNEDRVGLFVTFDESEPEKIRLANNDDYILGIVSGMPSVIGNGDEEWKKRYVLDDFGRYIQETFEYEEDGKTKTGTKWKENPEYDSTKPYAPRDERAEWSAIGLVGILSVYDDGTCQVNGYCKCKNNGIATVAEKGADTYRVIKRVTDNIVKVVLK